MSEPKALTNVRIIAVMRQNFKTRTTGGSHGDEERKGIRVGFAFGSTLQMGDSTGRLIGTVDRLDSRVADIRRLPRKLGQLFGDGPTAIYAKSSHPQAASLPDHRRRR